ncbi:MAG: molecular chaperone Hsp70, partial [bacterium]|nr:molecular chaperone Hsp70 [bacterium]
MSSTIDADDAFDPLVDQLPSRFVVGIDLGTTNSAASYVDTDESPWRIQTLSIPQLVGLGEVDSRDTLPSFHFEPTQGELQGDGLRLPWTNKQPDEFAVGVFAREQGSLAPARLIASAKSWLCHPGVDRTADILPWRAAEDIQRL